MQLEFDKEIDAILRKARGAKTVAASAGPHLDADTIAAFAENALPDKAKLLYLEHLADCDSCRKQLSFVIQMNKIPVATAASAPAVEPMIETSIPWYQSFFKAPNLALAMGALVLVFGGILGYVVIQKQAADSNTAVSQINQPEQSRGGPNLDDNAAPNSAPLDALVATANPTPPAVNMAANTSVGSPFSGAFGRTNTDTARSEAAPENFQLDGASGSENSLIIDGQETSRVMSPKKSAAPAANAAPGDRADQNQPDTVSTGVSSQSAELLPKGLNMSSVLKTAPSADGKVLKEEEKDTELEKRKQADDRSYREMRAAAKARQSSAGPAQNQLNQSNSNMPVTRVVGGKTFNNRDGAWYDSAYNGQATTNYRRGTTEYKKLDSGLRNIAETVGGTVVIMWKAKAYRIQ